MDKKEKFNWMAQWAANNGVALELEGECGFGRECVGITVNGSYPEYEWFDNDWNEVSGNGEVWSPDDAYHKHPCVAVLGRGEDAESQLYEWLKWFDDNGFKIEQGAVELKAPLDPIELMLGRNSYQRMVKVATNEKTA